MKSSEKRSVSESNSICQFTVGKPGEVIQPDCFSILPPQGQTSSSEPSSQSSILSHTADLEIHLGFSPNFLFTRHMAQSKIAQEWQDHIRFKRHESFKMVTLTNYTRLSNVRGLLTYLPFPHRKSLQTDGWQLASSLPSPQSSFPSHRSRSG